MRSDAVAAALSRSSVRALRVTWADIRPSPRISLVFIREKRIMMRGLSVVQLLLVTLSASLMSARETREIGGGNFMEDEQQWLSTVHQYSRTVKHWNRFRDVSFSAVCVFWIRALFWVFIYLHLQYCKVSLYIKSIDKHLLKSWLKKCSLTFPTLLRLITILFI